MLHLLAYAENVDASGTSFSTILVSAAAIVGAGIFALGPMLLAWSRKNRKAEAVVAFALLWGLAAAASLVYWTLVRSHWSHEQTIRIMSGYYDPTDASDAPKLPLIQWGALVVVYGGLLLFASRSSK